MSDLRDFIVAELEQQEAELTARLERVRAARSQYAGMPEGRPLRFRVLLNSHWASSGEQSVEHYGEGDVESVVTDAAMRFRAINERSDVQAACSVFALSESGVSVAIPEKHWVDALGRASAPSWPRA